MSKQLTVCGVAIKQDAEGRYCLNDLHKAAGGEERHKPKFFIKLDSTTELAGELEKGGNLPFEITRGRFGGTFVVKELVYAYAMWISPKFHLEVIRSYDRLATEGVAVHYTAAESVLEDPLSYMEKIIAQAKVLKAERDRLALENQEMAPKAVVFDNCVALRQESLATFVRTLEGVNTMAIISDHRIQSTASKSIASTTGASTSGLKSFPYRLNVIPPLWWPRMPPTSDSTIPFCFR